MIDKILEASKILDEVDDYIDTLPDEQSKCDSKLSDLYHLLENNNLNASQCCKFVKEMKSVCTERRKVKIEFEVGKTFQTYQNRLNNRENRQLLMCELYKKEKRMKAEYQYRIYTEQELIELGILKESKENEDGYKYCNIDWKTNERCRI